MKSTQQGVKKAIEKIKKINLPMSVGRRFHQSSPRRLLRPWLLTNTAPCLKQTRSSVLETWKIPIGLCWTLRWESQDRGRRLLSPSSKNSAKITQITWNRQLNLNQTLKPKKVLTSTRPVFEINPFDAIHADKNRLFMEEEGWWWSTDGENSLLDECVCCHIPL